MMRAVILSYWETRRIMKSRLALIGIVSLPLVLAGITMVFSKWQKSAHITQLFPLMAILSAAGLIISRHLRDRTSGFAAAVRSTPSREPIITASRVITCLVIVLVQSLIFFGLVRMG